jgi:hypothetical protein
MVVVVHGQIPGRTINMRKSPQRKTTAAGSGPAENLPFVYHAIA